MSESEAGLSIEDQKQELKRTIVSLGKELKQRTEALPFPGMDEETLNKLREEFKEYPDYATDPDELIARMERDGVKIVLGEDAESGNVFVLPFSSDNIDMDFFLPRHLSITEDVDPSFRSLILAQKAFLELVSKAAQ